jgi:hypothetical protein
MLTIEIPSATEESLSLGEYIVEHRTRQSQEPRVGLLESLVASREFEIK